VFNDALMAIDAQGEFAESQKTFCAQSAGSALHKKRLQQSAKKKLFGESYINSIGGEPTDRYRPNTCRNSVSQTGPCCVMELHIGRNEQLILAVKLASDPR
jgi:hypothetical protein